MPRGLVIAIGLTDGLFILYWVLSALALAGLVAMPPSFMYAGYDTPWVCAWNWSFLPLDAAFSLSGMAAVMSARRGLAIWQPLAVISLTLTMAAGLMADSYWLLAGPLDPAWFLANLALVVWPVPYLARLIAASHVARRPG